MYFETCKYCGGQLDTNYTCMKCFRDNRSDNTYTTDSTDSLYKPNWRYDQKKEGLETILRECGVPDYMLNICAHSLCNFG